MKVYIRCLHRPGEAPGYQIQSVFLSQKAALDGRRAKLTNNVAWREMDEGWWSTRSPEYVYQLYPYYTVVEMEVEE